ncbi:signal peptidase II [Solwaraspora sp. WMMD1047]|uniref:signal peptidase II n=1 Tax=Solwaraspora sp. WMMD1047 TaxID=3016102 RepID=UPI0024166F48|nr:signal peptidase II [Solwaraspora sp. WMMD1047]MDG4828006.1 signal peptidase II [Solwaraspora sp. WMMD1047]
MSVETDQPASEPVDEHRPRPLRLPAFALAALLLVLDQATKLWATSTLADRDPIPVLGDLLQLRLVYNPGAAFSIGTGFTWIFTVVAAVAVVVLTRMAWRVRSRWWAVGLGLVLGGATTHLLDRLFREPSFGRGHVVDFIDYGPFVGNVADIALVGGVALLVLLNLRDAPTTPRPTP